MIIVSFIAYDIIKFLQVMPILLLRAKEKML